MDLSTRYLGLELRTPLVASSSPLTGSIDELCRLEDAGVSAVVLPSLFEEQLTHEALELDSLWDETAAFQPEATGYFPEAQDTDVGASDYLTLVEQAKRSLNIPVVASLNGVTPGGWARYAQQLAEAGADAVELNLYAMATDPAVTGSDLEQQQLELVSRVRAAVEVPIAVKLGPFYSSFANMATRVVEAGANGLVLFNRFYQPDLDLEARDVVPRLVLSHSEELRLPLRWIAVLHGRVNASLAATSGVHTGLDAAKALLSGADIAMMASALLENGPQHVQAVERELVDLLREYEYDSVGQLRGSYSQQAVAEPVGWERANYLRVLASWSTRQAVGPARAARVISAN